MITAFIRCLWRDICLFAEKEATELGKRARELKKAADELHQEERNGSKGRKWRKNTKAVEKVYLNFQPLVLKLNVTFAT